MQKILGLDIGSYSIKAVEILNTFKTYEIAAYYEVVIPEIEGIDPSQIGSAALEQLFADNNIEADRIYTAVQGLLVSTRMISLQNIKKRLIPIAVRENLEDQAPFDIDEAVLDHQLLDTNEGTTNIIAVMAKKDDVEIYLNKLKEHGIEPKVIDVDYLSYLNILPFIIHTYSNPIQLNNPVSEVASAVVGEEKIRKSIKFRNQLIIDIGHMKTSLILFKGAKIAGTRSIRVAGQHFTEHLQNALGVTYNEAQRLKHAVSKVEYNPDATAEPGKEKEFLVSRHLTVAISELIREIVRTLYSFKAQDGVFPDIVYLTGGSSCIQNLSDYISETIEVPVRKLELDSAKVKTPVKFDESKEIFGQSIAIGLRGIHSKIQSQINFRRGELAFVGSYNQIIKQALHVGLLVISLFLCLGVSYGVKWWLYSNQINTIKKEYQIKLKTILNGEPRQLANIAASSNWDLKTYNAQAIKLITEETKNIESALQAQSERKSAIPLRVLEEVSKAIPKELKIDVTDISIKGALVTIEAETDSIATSESIINNLKKNVTIFQSVEKKKSDDVPGSDGKIKKIWISAALKEGF